MSGPVAGATTTYTYDPVGRRRTTTQSDGYVVTVDYDALDRPTVWTMPDATQVKYTYDRLDLVKVEDRRGRAMEYTYDPLRRPLMARDSAGRTVTQRWCACGILDGLIDAKGQQTTWERDLQNRVTREVRTDGTTATLYSYEGATGRLKTVTDAKAQVTTLTYAADNALVNVAYTNAPITTPGVNVTYDTNYPRLATMTDGIGTTSYAYHPIGTLGAGQLASVCGAKLRDGRGTFMAHWRGAIA